MRHFTALLLAAAALTMVGCNTDQADTVAVPAASSIAQSDTRAEPRAAPVLSEQAANQPRVTHAPAPAQNPHAARDISPFPVVGAAACDSFAEVVRQCLNVHSYGKSRVLLRREYSHAIRGWVKSVNAGTDKAIVGQQCVAFRTTFATKLHAIGCTGI